MVGELDLGHFEEHKDNVHAGWHPLLAALHGRLTALWPEYQVAQVKEKWGGLRVYIDYLSYETADPLIDDETANTCEDLLEEIETESYRTCEYCGKTPAAPRNVGWVKTMCDDCAGGSPVMTMWMRRGSHGTLRAIETVQPFWANPEHRVGSTEEEIEMNNLLSELKTGLHDLWARLEADGHALAADARALYEKTLHGSETAVDAAVKEATPVAEKAVVDVAEAAAHGAIAAVEAEGTK